MSAIANHGGPPGPVGRGYTVRCWHSKGLVTFQKSGLIGSIAYAQNAASTAIAATTTTAKMMALRLPIAVRCPQSGHLATSWSKSTPQAAHLRSSGCPVDSGSAGMAGGYAEWAKGGTVFLYESTNRANAAGFAKTFEPKETREGH